jgi:peroxiredoxin
MDRNVILKRAIDVILIGAMVYAALLVFGVVRRGGRFDPGTPAPDISVQSLDDGRTLTLQDFKGRALLLVFFSTSCPSCKAELPDIEEYQARGRDRLVALVVSSDEPAALKAFLQSRNSKLKAALDAGPTHSAYHVDTIPYLVVIDPDGRVQSDTIGSVRWTDIEPWLPK